MTEETTTPAARRATELAEQLQRTRNELREALHQVQNRNRQIATLQTELEAQREKCARLERHAHRTRRGDHAWHRSCETLPGADQADEFDRVWVWARHEPLAVHWREVTADGPWQWWMPRERREPPGAPS